MPLARLCVTILLTVLVFLLCDLPLSIILFLISWFPISNYLSCYLHTVTIVLWYVNSFANPIFYFFIGSYRQQQQHQTHKLLLQRVLQDTPKQDECGDSHSQGTLELSAS